MRLTSHTLGLCNEFNSAQNVMQRKVLLPRIFRSAIIDVGTYNWRKGNVHVHFDTLNKMLWPILSRSIRYKLSFDDYCNTAKKALYFNLDWNVCQMTTWATIEKAVKILNDFKGSYEDKMAAAIKRVETKKPIVCDIVLEEIP